MSNYIKIRSPKLFKILFYSYYMGVSMDMITPSKTVRHKKEIYKYQNK